MVRAIKKNIHIYLSYSAGMDKHKDVGMCCSKGM